MEILDGKRHDKKSERFHLDHSVYLLNGGRHWGWLDHSAEPKNFTPQQIKRGNEVFTKAFRALVNQWIDSGKDARGIESPLRRYVNKAPRGYTEPLLEVLRLWLVRNMPKLVLMQSGKVAIAVQPPNHWELDEHGLVKYLEPGKYAKECAIFHFKELLDTPGANRLARCNNPECSRPYYLRRRLPRKAEIKRGTYCGNCAGAGSMKRTKVSREVRRQKLVNLAADSWNDWKPTRLHGKKSDWVAQQMNKQSDSAITGRWISRNLKAIEIEVERRKHAKG